MPVRRPPVEEALSPRTREELKQRQLAASVWPRKSKAIGAAWKAFGGTSYRKEVWQKLEQAFYSVCAYCEAILPRDIEHYRPKSEYPQQMFRWDNFLLCCKNCNTDKLAKFLDADGEPLVIDPCAGDPADHFTWSLDTGKPVFNPDPVRRKKAQSTVNLFKLDAQQHCRERRARAQVFYFVLLQSIEESPVPSNVHDWLIDELRPTRPYRSVLRQIVSDPKNRTLITHVKAAVPEAAASIAELQADARGQRDGNTTA